MTRGRLSWGCSLEQTRRQVFESKLGFGDMIAGSSRGREGGRENETGRQPNKGTSPSKLPLWTDSSIPPGTLGATVERGLWSRPAPGDRERWSAAGLGPFPTCCVTTDSRRAPVGTAGAGAFSRKEPAGEHHREDWAGGYGPGESEGVRPGR